MLISQCQAQLLPKTVKRMKKMIVHHKLRKKIERHLNLLENNGSYTLIIESKIGKLYVKKENMYKRKMIYFGNMNIHIS